MTNDGIEAYNRQLKSAKESGIFTRAKSGSKLLEEAIPLFEAIIVEWLNEPDKRERLHVNSPIFPMMTSMSPLDLATITAKVTIDQFYKTEVTQGNLAGVVSNAIHNAARNADFKKRNKADFDIAQNLMYDRMGRNNRTKLLNRVRKHSTHTWTPWPLRVKQVFGLTLLHLFRISTGMIEFVTKRDVNYRGSQLRLMTIIVPTGDTLNWLENCNLYNEERRPVFLPMLKKPHQYTNPWDGGYDESVFTLNSVFRGARNQQVDKMSQNAMPQVYKAINILQSSKWRINEDVYALFDYVWSEDLGDVAGLPPKNPLERKTKPPGADEDKAIMRDYKRLLKLQIIEEGRTVSKRIATARLRTAAELLGDSAFYFPHYSDFRGRLYPFTNCISPQGNDVSKAILESHEGQVLTDSGVRWMCIHGANTWGVKGSFDERIAWVKENHDVILKVSNNPWDTTEINWQEADDPWQFIAFCFAYSKWASNPSTALIHLPCHMDGTNNGLQLYSLLMRDKVNAKNTNVLYEGTIEDIYQNVADDVLAQLQADSLHCEVPQVKFTEEQCTQFARNILSFLGGTVDRKATKKTVMTLAYAVTAFTNRTNVDTYFDDLIDAHPQYSKVNPPFQKLYSHTYYFAEILWSKIHKHLGSAIEGMEFLQECALIMAKQGLELNWKAPSGFLVEQRKVKYSVKACYVPRRVTPGKRCYVNVSEATEDLSPRKQRSGIPANFVHSLDASVMTLTTNRCYDKGLRFFSMVHDSFGTLPNDCETLAKTLREVTVDIFSKDILKDNREIWQKQLVDIGSSKVLPEVPPYGELDINCVMVSPYMFS